MRIMGRTGSVHSFSSEANMAGKPKRDDKKKKPETRSEKKAETVQLSPEELRAISGGATSPPGGPKPSPLDERFKKR
jgi:hypothetical protein